jgi:ribosomal protein S18 acetylase RimI-like enzyme
MKRGAGKPAPFPLTPPGAAPFNRKMLKIRPLLMSDLEALHRFTDREIGAGYYSFAEIEEVFEKSRLRDVMHSLVLIDEDGTIAGMRITYPPGKWSQGKGSGLHPEKWPYPLEQTAYFQSLFLASSLQGQGWGGRMSRAALAILRLEGTKGVVCHSWKESPHGSSTRYLQKLGFALIAEHPQYWKNVPYLCTRCLTPPCLCTAQEMYLDLERIP